MDTKTYNGWTNYETWAMSLWMDNDQGSYNYARELAEEHGERDDDGNPVNVYKLADALKDWQYEDMPDLDASVWSDLLSTSFGEIDWHEIAENMMSEQ